MTKTKRIFSAVVALWALGLFVPSLSAADKIKALIVDGQNNHKWQQTTPIMKKALEACGRFSVDVSTSPPKKKASKDAWDQWRPKFSDYGVIVLNYNGKEWPQPVKDSFVAYVKNGGGVVVVHAADNAFAKWKEYNEIIAIGGWGGRNAKSGPYVRWRDGKMVIEDVPGRTGGHGAKYEMLVENRDLNHPITKGMPAKWLHTRDELYQNLRGPAKNVTLLATSSADRKGGKNEPVMLTISFGKGRIFHTVLGHDGTSVSGLGFQVYLQRGAEWCATGKVTLAPVSVDKLVAEGKAAVGVK